jgi:hypothetical protein
MNLRSHRHELLLACRAVGTSPDGARRPCGGVPPGRARPFCPVPGGRAGDFSPDLPFLTALEGVYSL